VTTSRLRTLAVCVIAAAALAACSPSPNLAPGGATITKEESEPTGEESTGAEPTGESGPLRIGVEGPITGSQSVTGVGMVNGARLAADAINAAGGLNGRQVEIVPIDDAADAATGVAAATAAIEAGLDGIIGPYNSGVGVETLPLYEKAGLVPIRLTSNSSTNGLGYTLQPMDYQIAPTAAEGLTTWLQAKTVAIIYDASQNYTTQIATDLKADLEKAGVTVPVYEAIQPGASSYSAQVAAAAAATPDVIYAATYFPEGGLIAKEMFDTKVAARCVADYASNDPGFITTAGLPAAEACAVVGVPSPGDFPTGPEFVAEYTAAFGQAPGTWSPYTYDSMNLLAAAATAAGGFEAAKLEAFLNTVSGWKGVTGSVTIDPANGNRDPATVVFLKVTPAGEFTVDTAWSAAVGAGY